MSTNHNRIRVADLETNQPNKILKTNAKGELEFSDASAIETDTNNVKLTGNQTIRDEKVFSTTKGNPSLNATVSLSGTSATNFSSVNDGLALYVAGFNNKKEIARIIAVDGSATALNLYNQNSATGDFLKAINPNNNIVSKIDKDGTITAKSFIKTGGTNEQFLMADGSVKSIQTDGYNALDCTTEGKVLDARQGKVLKDMIDLKPVDLATDGETQISAVVSEDKKVVSRLKLFNWWQWITKSPLKWYNTITLNQGNSTKVPLIIPTGVLTNTPIIGAIETDSKSIYYTSNDGVRKNLSDKAIYSNTTLSLNYFGKGFIGLQEFFTPLVTNSKLFNNGNSQYDVYSIFSSVVISHWFSPVTSIKLELQINISNSAYPETWYTMAIFEANRNDWPSALPHNIILSADLTTSIIGDKYLFFSGTDTSFTKNNTIQDKTNNLSIGSQPLKQDMLVSVRIKSNLVFNTNTTYQQFFANIPMFQVEKKQS